MDRQLLDAVAIGQFTPGPLFTTATFIGYQLLGVPGAIVATLGIFLPGFILVLITNPFIPKMRQSRWTASLLDGVNVAAIELMAAVTLEIARAALIDPLTIALTPDCGGAAHPLQGQFDVADRWRHHRRRGAADQQLMCFICGGAAGRS